MTCHGSRAGRRAVDEGALGMVRCTMDAIGEHFGHPAQMPRAGLPEEIGPVAAFLASRRNSYMTGANDQRRRWFGLHVTNSKRSV